jgi:flagellar motor switch protein FliG
MKTLAGPERAAMIVLGLDEEVAADVLRHMPEDDVRRLADAVTHLEPVPLDLLEPAFEDFDRAMRAPVLPRGGADYLRRLAASALGEERVRRLLNPAPGPRAPMESVRGARPATLAQILADEHPQVAAVVLAQLEREQAAKVLKALPEELQADLLARLAALEEVPEDALLAAAEAVGRNLEAAGGGAEISRQPCDGVARAAALLNELTPDDSQRLLGVLESRDAALGPKVREAMFTFEDLGRMERRHFQVLMREIESDSLLVALKTAGEELRERFLGAVSSRAAATLREDLAALPPMRVSDVERAQRAIVTTAMRLAQEGRLTLPGASGEAMV